MKNGWILFPRIETAHIRVKNMPWLSAQLQMTMCIERFKFIRRDYYPKNKRWRRWNPSRRKRVRRRLKSRCRNDHCRSLRRGRNRNQQHPLHRQRLRKHCGQAHIRRSKNWKTLLPGCRRSTMLQLRSEIGIRNSEKFSGINFVYKCWRVSAERVDTFFSEAVP